MGSLVTFVLVGSIHPSHMRTHLQRVDGQLRLGEGEHRGQLGRVEGCDDLCTYLLANACDMRRGVHMMMYGKKGRSNDIPFQLFRALHLSARKIQ